MSTRLIVATAAAVVVGYATGSVQAGAQTFALVYGVTGFLDPNRQGPRLEDRRIQTSAYGVAVPRAYGCVRIAGNVIEGFDLEETISEEDGKGGPGVDVASYHATFALLLAGNRQRGVRRIWGDSVLIYDGTNEAATAPDFTFYPGDEEQLPDPTLEEAWGIGNVSAYRGWCYLMFRRLPLEKFGNRLPSITAELLGDGDFGADVTPLGSVETLGYVDAVQALDGNVIVVSDTGYGTGTMVLTRIDVLTGNVLAKVTHPIDIDGDTYLVFGGKVCYVPPLDEVWLVDTARNIQRFAASTLTHVGGVRMLAPVPEDPAQYNFIAMFGSLTGAGSLTVPTLAYEPTSRRVLALGGVYHAINLDAAVESSHIDAVGVLHQGEGTDLCKQLVTGGSVIVCAIIYNGTIAVLPVSPQFGALTTDPVITPNVITTRSGGAEHGIWDTRRQRYVIAGGTEIVVVSDADPPTFTVHTIAGSGSMRQVQYMSEFDAIAIWTQLAGFTQLRLFDAEDFGLIYDSGSLVNYGVTRVSPSPVDPGRVFVVGNQRPYEVAIFGTTVGACVADLCRASGLPNDAFDVSALTQRLRGYIVGQQGPARGAIEQLALVYGFEAAEIDDKIVFKLRGGTPVATIPIDDCGAGIDKADEVPIHSTRGQELDLPSRVAITAPDPAADHQPGTQYAERLAGEAGAEMSTSLAVVLTATECKRLADYLLFDAWASRERLTFATGHKYAHLTPTDIVTLDGRRVRLLSRTDEGVLHKWEGVVEDADVMAQTSLGVQGNFPRQVVPIQVPTTMLLLDTALLRDADDAPGAYVAAYGVPPHWRGGVIFATDDAGVTWDRETTVPAPGPGIGVASNALGNFAGGNVFDESNALIVALHNGTPSSTTRLGVLAGSNGIAVRSGSAWEIVQYRDAAQQPDGTWRLSGLLRGRRGTDHAMAGHAVGDTVVLLDATTLRNIAIETAQIGLPREYRAVSIGDTLGATPSQTATIYAERLEPLAPVHLGGGRDVDGNLLLRWTRRSRVGGEWRDSVDVPLDETAEAYEVDIYTSSARTTVARTISAMTQTATYSAAQQAADFGAPQAAVYWSVAQMSAIVGRGHVAQGTT